MDSKNFTIGVLSTTAAILLAALLIIQTRPQTARADGMTILSGDYSISVGAVTRNDEDLLYIIDSPQELLNTYRFDSRAKQILLVQTISLKEMRGVGSKSTGKKKSKKPSRSRKGKNKP